MEEKKEEVKEEEVKDEEVEFEREEEDEKVEDSNKRCESVKSKFIWFSQMFKISIIRFIMRFRSLL